MCEEGLQEKTKRTCSPSSSRCLLLLRILALSCRSFWISFARALTGATFSLSPSSRSSRRSSSNGNLTLRMILVFLLISRRQ
jgi:hypothetical protein